MKPPMTLPFALSALLAATTMSTSATAQEPAQQPAQPARQPAPLPASTMPATALPEAPPPPATATQTEEPLPSEAVTDRLTKTDTTPMPVVIEPPSWRLRLGVDASGGVLFGGPAGAAGLAARIGARRDRLHLLVELGLHGALGGAVRDDDGVHVSSAGALTVASLTPSVQYDVGDHGAFIGGGLVLGSGTFTSSEDRVDGDDITSQVSKSAAFIPGLDARIGWRLGEAHNVTLTAGVKVLATAVRTDTIAVPSSSDPTRTSVEGFGAAVLPTLSVGYDFM